MPVPGFALGDHLTGGHVQGGKQRGGAVADVVVGDTLDVPRPIGNSGWVRSRAWICVFSSTQSTTALSGGFR